MKNVGRIFSIIGGVLAILCGVGLIGYGVSLLLLNLPEVKDIFLEAMQKLAEITHLPFVKFAELAMASAVVNAIIQFVFAVISFVAGGLSLACHKNKAYVATIVLGALAYFQVFVVLGAIFGLIFDKKKE